MPITVPDNWPDWPQDGLEYLGHCPVCGCDERRILHANLIDRWFHAPGRWTLYECSHCRSGYIDPRPNEATIGLAYIDYETHRPTEQQPVGPMRLSTRLRNGYLNTKYCYRMQPASRWGYLAMHFLPPPLRLEWDHYARHLAIPTPGFNKLLDVGCGNGDFLARARWQGWDVHGIDVDESALAHARSAGIPVIHGTIEPDRFPPDSFDVITSHQVIEHAHQPIHFLETLHGWLKPGGRLWLGTPNMSSTLHSEFGADWCDLHPPQHLVLFSPESLISATSSAGFTDARLLARGYLDSHFYRQSLQMQTATTVGDWASFNENPSQPASILKKVALEVAAWLSPERCSDLIVTARKSAK